MLFEIRELDCVLYDDMWSENTSYHIGEFKSDCYGDGLKRSFTRALRERFGIRFKLNRTLIVDDGEFLSVIDRKTKEPLFVAIPKA